MSATSYAAKPIDVDTSSDELPEGWVLPQLSSLLTVNYGKGLTESNRRPGRFPVYGSNGIVGQHNIPLTRATTIIIGRKGTVGAVHLSNGPCWPIDTTYFVEQFHGLDPRYVFHGLRTLNLSERDTSTAIPGLNRDDLYSQQLPLPPLPEQTRIVSKIEELLRHVNASREHLAKVPKILKALRQSVLAAACSGRLTEDWREVNPHIDSAEALLKKIAQQQAGDSPRRAPHSPPQSISAELPDIPENWSWTTIEHIADVQGGIQKQPKRTPKRNAYPYLRVANVLRDRLDLSEIQYMELFEGELETYRLQPKDLLIVEGNGSISEIGRSALWKGEIKHCVHQNHIIRVRARACLPQYLNRYWNSPVGIGRVMEAAVTTAGLFSLSTKKIAALPAPIPPIEEQHEIVRRVDILFKLADKIEKRVEAATKRADKLTQSILAKAFRGELVPTEAELARREDREYEPASVLLARIKAERAEVAPSNNGASRRRHS